jgi:hypothetical protein
MSARCEKLLDLLGKPRPTSAELLIQLIDDLGEKPKVDCTHDRLWSYDFPRSGVSLEFDTKLGMFIYLTLFVLVLSDENGELGSRRPYDGALPFGFTASDSYSEVEAKLPGGTMVVKDYRFAVDLRPLVVRTAFHPPGPPRAPLHFISVEYVGPAVDVLALRRSVS